MLLLLTGLLLSVSFIEWWRAGVDSEKVQRGRKKTKEVDRETARHTEREREETVCGTTWGLE